MSASIVAEVGMGASALGFPLGGADDCPVLGGADSIALGGWGIVSGWD